MEHLAQARGLALDDGVTFGELQVHVRPQILVQAEHIEQEGVDVDRVNAPRPRPASVNREIVDHVLHRGDLRDDRLRTSHERLFVGAFELASELDREPLGGELDRSQWILDFMSQPSRNLGPRGVALRFRKFSHVVEDHDAAGRRLAGKPRSAHQEHARMAGNLELRNPSATNSANPPNAGSRAPIPRAVRRSDRRAAAAKSRQRLD